MVESFRPYPEEGKVVSGTFVLRDVLVKTIIEAPVHFLAIIPHLLIPLYGGYRILKIMGYWTAQVDFVVDIILVPLLQGLSVGGILGTSFLRYLTPTGRKIAHKRQDQAATDEEDLHQHRLDIIFWSFCYLGFATVIWQFLPAADGPGIASLKKLAGRFGIDRIGVDVGNLWKTGKY